MSASNKKASNRRTLKKMKGKGKKEQPFLSRLNKTMSKKYRDWKLGAHVSELQKPSLASRLGLVRPPKKNEHKPDSSMEAFSKARMAIIENAKEKGERPPEAVPHKYGYFGHPDELKNEKLKHKAAEKGLLGRISEAASRELSRQSQQRKFDRLLRESQKIRATQKTSPSKR